MVRKQNFEFFLKNVNNFEMNGFDNKRDYLVNNQRNLDSGGTLYFKNYKKTPLANTSVQLFQAL